MPIFELILIRKWLKSTYTIGKLYHDQIFLCETMEPTARELHDLNHDGDFMDEGEGKIMGKTAIPCGRYQIIMSWFAKHQRLAPLLLNVPGFKGIFIHSGSIPEHTEGCILCGENKAVGQLLYSKYQTNRVEMMIREALANKNEIFITIKM